ncbi:MAG: ABC transporter permease subunit [Oscillospiraceae bacterium]|jgi:peptide/nickel transport system permease protein|nr:ABC transporter permease subunit [Oscillospiraceae bacterium]
MLKKTLRNPQAAAGLAIIALFLLTAVFAPALAPNSTDAIDVMSKYLSAGARFPLGTDQLGRCVLSRLIYGARSSAMIVLPSLAVIGFCGVVCGASAAYIGGAAERAFIVVCDVFMAFPPLVIAISLVGALGQGMLNIIAAVFFSAWVWFAKVVRTWAAIEKGKDYVTASKIAGCTRAGVIFRHIIPNILPQCVVYLSTGVASAILMVSGFSFLGLGFEAGAAEWGAMLNDAQANFHTHPELLVYPGLCVLIAAAGFNLFGEALRDVVTPEGAGQ